jgi:hypothetical protein
VRAVETFHIYLHTSTDLTGQLIIIMAELANAPDLISGP